VIDHVAAGAIARGRSVGRVLGVLLDAADEMAERPELAITERRLPLTFGQVVGSLGLELLEIVRASHGHVHA
jgi:hypothetical protein